MFPRRQGKRDHYDRQRSVLIIIQSYVREAAAELLGACLEILIQRERQYKGPLIAQVLADAKSILEKELKHSVESIHGALLEYRALFLHAGSVSELSLRAHLLFRRSMLTSYP